MFAPELSLRAPQYTRHHASDWSYYLGLRMRCITSSDINTRQIQNRRFDAYYRKVVRVLFAFHSEEHRVPRFKEHVGKIPEIFAVRSFDFLPPRNYTFIIN